MSFVCNSTMMSERPDQCSLHPEQTNVTSTRPKKACFGRKGDPRMHRAVAARLANPKMSLLEALRAGGFEFPEDGELFEKTSLKKVKDKDSVEMSQRKNQLSRRLRMKRKEYEEGKSSNDSKSPSSSQNGDCKSQDESTQEQNIQASKSTCPIPRQCEFPQASLEKNCFEAKDSFHTIYNDNGTQDFNISTHNHSDDCVNYGQTNNDMLVNHQTFSQSLEAPKRQPSSDHKHVSYTIGSESKRKRLSLSRNLVALNDEEKRKMTVALNLFRAEHSSLLKRCLLSAGFEGDSTEECNGLYLQFLSNTLDIERQRFSRLAATFCNSNEETIHKAQDMTQNFLMAGDNGGAINIQNPTTKTPVNIQDKFNDSLLTKVTNYREKYHVSDLPKQDESHYLEGRHLHRLSGECGHKAIIHKPVNAPAHVDFVVNGKVECYQGCNPLLYDAPGATSTALWPSQYRCDELKCKDNFSGNLQTHYVNCGPNHCKTTRGGFCRIVPPRVLDDVNLNDEEWDEFMDFPEGKGDDILLSLLKMSEGDRTEVKSVDRVA